MENGLAIRGDRIFLNTIEIPAARIALATQVDRRTVGETVKMVNSDSQLKMIFSHPQSAGLSLRGVAKKLGLGVVKIMARDPKTVGHSRWGDKVLAEAGVSIRQALVSDPELGPDPKLVLMPRNVFPVPLCPSC